MELFASIERMIEYGKSQRGMRKFHWVLPRQVGATNWFHKTMLKDLRAGLNVCSVGLQHNRIEIQRDPSLAEYVKSKQLVVFTNKSGNIPRGRTFDRIYGDNTKYFNSTDLIDVMFGLVPSLNIDGHAVFIDTTEGD